MTRIVRALRAIATSDPHALSHAADALGLALDLLSARDTATKKANGAA